MPSSSARCLNGYVMAVFYLHNIIFLFTIKIEDQHCCLALWNLVIFVLSPQLIRSDIGELGLSVEILKHIQRTWVISLLQIIFTKFSTARELILYQPSLQLKMSSYLKSIVEIMFFFKPPHDSTDKALSRFSTECIFVYQHVRLHFKKQPFNHHYSVESKIPY